MHRRCYSGSSLIKEQLVFMYQNQMQDILEGSKRKTEYTIMSLIWREVQLEDSRTTFHLGSSLSRAEEQGVLFAAGGPVKILVEFTELEVSPV